MSALDPAFAAPVQALTDSLQREQQARCAEELDTAHVQARRLLREARHEARQRIADACRYERERLAAALRLAEARIATRRRQAQQQDLALVSAAAWERLPGLLRRRWTEPVARRHWCETAATLALARLSSLGTWTVEIAAGADAADWQAVRARLAAAGIEATQAAPAAALEAGLVCRCSGASLDASLDGLLAQRQAVLAAFLDLWCAPEGDA